MKGFDFHHALKTLRNDLEFLRGNLVVMNEMKVQDQKGFLIPYEHILRDIIYDAEDIMEENEYKLHKQNNRLLMKYISLPLSRENWERRKRLKEIKQKIRRYKEEIKLSLKLDHSLSNQQPPKRDQSIQYPTMIHGDEVVGLDSDLEKIKQWILKPNGLLKVIAIWGMGGVGKTTLAQTICKDRSMKECFDQILFITISFNFDLKRKLRDILVEMKGTETSPREDELDLLEELHKKLNEKRYLIVLDDVWQINERSWWNSLKSALPLKNNGSCVIITTRLKEVARLMGATEKHLHYHKTLSWNNSWLLFAKNAFPREDSRSPNPYMEAIAKKFAAKCGGLPLGIKVVAGGMLRKEPSTYHWRIMAQNLNEELHKKSESLDFALRKSYEALPPYLKHCMLCFSIFPEAYEISVEEVVHLWTSQGLIHKTEGKTAIENGEEFFDELINKCLLIGERKDVFETRYQSCRVHELIHKMIVNVAKETNFMLLEKEGMTLSCSTRVGFIWGSDMNHFSKLSSKLRILVGREIPENREFISNIKSKMLKQKWLRALDLHLR